jgi:hypothetical protein
MARIVKRRAKAAGLDPARYAGHSLTAGLATTGSCPALARRTGVGAVGLLARRTSRRIYPDETDHGPGANQFVSHTALNTVLLQRR